MLREGLRINDGRMRRVPAHPASAVHRAAGPPATAVLSHLPVSYRVQISRRVQSHFA
jgi:hypothetical protein